MKRLSWVLQVVGIAGVLTAIGDLSVHAAVIIGASGLAVLGYVIERDA